jgi:hypothetical protein
VAHNWRINFFCNNWGQFFYFCYKRKKITKNIIFNTLENISQLKKNKQQIKPLQWINCREVEDIIEEDDRYYFGCEGGVLISSKEGKLINQISMHNGLTHHHVTSLLKEEDTLYVGTYNGLSIYNLRNNTSKKITVDKGLAGNTILSLANDGDRLVIGTDDGLSFYDKKTGKISNFQLKIENYINSYPSVDEIIVTEKAIHVKLLTHPDNLLFRFDKKTLSWEKINTDGLKEYNLSFVSLAHIKNYVYLMDNKNNLYRYEDKNQSKIEKININNGDDFFDGIKEKERQFPFPHSTKKILFGYDDSLHVIFYDTVYSYNSKNQKLKFEIKLLDYSYDYDYKYIFNKYIVKNSKIYFQLSNDSVWMRFFDFNNKFKRGKIELNHPVYFNESIVSIVNNLAFICADNKIYQLNLERNLFKKWLDKECVDSVFTPIPQTNKIFYFFQKSKFPMIFEPDLSVINFLDKSIKKIELPNWLNKELLNKDNNSWQILMFEKYQEKSKVIFSFFPSNPKEKTTREVEINLINENWSKMSSSIDKKNNQQVNQYLCNQKFNFKGKVFEESSCNTDLINDKKWVLKGPSNYFNRSEKLRLIKKNSSGRDQVFYFPEKVSLIPYSTEAFPSYKYEGRQNGFLIYYYKAINSVKVDKENIYIATNVGLYVFNTKNFSWKIITTDNGLVSNNVLNLAVDNENKIILAITEGGLSLITLEN